MMLSLSEREAEGSRKFLRGFQNHELLSLVETVTNRKVAVQNKTEAIEAIILYSESALELLRRKKVKKEYIFSHLADEKVSASSTADKASLVRQLLLHWGTEISELLLEDDELGENPAKDGTPAEDHETAQVQALAEQFTLWFYKQLNLLIQAGTSHSPPSDWGPHHFWPDCKLKLFITTTAEQRDESFIGAVCVAERFKSFVSEEGLIFNPNISPEGTVGLEDPHGLVEVRVCGTVHRLGDCVGLFKQQFGLIRDPFQQNNWKIKVIQMRLEQVTDKGKLALPAGQTLAVL